MQDADVSTFPPFPTRKDAEPRQRLPHVGGGSRGGLLIFLIVVFIYSLAEQLEVMDLWAERPYLFVFPMIGAMAAILLAFSVLYRWDEVPFLVVTVIFLCAFGTLALSFWPYMIPFVLTIEDAAAPRSSLAFMFGERVFSSSR